MIPAYRIAIVVVIALFGLTFMASLYGWGLSSDASALAQASSARGGSLHIRSYYGGGPGFGK